MKPNTYPKILAICLIALLCFMPMYAVGPNDKPNKLEMREMYRASVENQAKTEEMLAFLNRSAQGDALVVAYKGAAQSLMAKHSFFPIKKLDWLKKCELSMKKAVDMDPRNIEIRYLRFAYQHNTPAFLGYSGDVENDRKILITELQVQEKEWREDRKQYENVIDFLLKTGRCTEAEKTVLTNLKKNNRKL